MHSCESCDATDNEDTNLNAAVSALNAPAAVTTTGPLLLFIDIEITKYGQKH